MVDDHPCLPQESKKRDVLTIAHMGVHGKSHNGAFPLGFPFKACQKGVPSKQTTTAYGLKLGIATQTSQRFPSGYPFKYQSLLGVTPVWKTLI